MFFFLSCTINYDSIVKLKKEKEIISIYNACGRDPLFLVYETDSISNAIELNSRLDLKIKYMSVAQTIMRPEEKPRTTEDKNILFWVFIRGLKERFSTLMDNKQNFSECAITEKYALFGEYNYIVKLYTSKITGTDNFLNLCRKEGLSTSTKCVLSTLKENGVNTPQDMPAKKAEVDSVKKKDVYYAAARVMFNKGNILQEDRNEQERLLGEELSGIGVAVPEADKEKPTTVPSIDQLVLSPELAIRNESSQDDLRHGNELIDRYSIKLDKGGWRKVLFFFKASPGEKDKLAIDLQENFLGVAPKHFSRKLYHITGDNDFMVPFDCLDIIELDGVVEKFITTFGESITAMTNTVCQLDDPRKNVQIPIPSPLEPLEIHSIEALLINATHMKHFERRLRSGELFCKQSPRLEEIGYTSREDYVRSKMVGVSVNSPQDTFNTVGVKSAIEFKDGALIQTLVKFYFNNKVSRTQFYNELESRQGQCDIIAIQYKPVRDPLTVTCILMVKKMVELEVFFEEMRQYCRKIEFHIIFHQEYYSKVLEKDNRCRPCFHPIICPKKCSDDCNKCTNKGLKKRLTTKCGNCIRYITIRESERILNIDFKEPIKQVVNITLVGVDMTLYQYFALDGLLDRKVRDKGPDNLINRYRDFYEHLVDKKKGLYTHPDAITKGYDDIQNKDSYRNGYEEAVISVLNLNSNSDIIIFPEYSIPRNVYDKIRHYSIKKNCVIVAGSHIDGDGFNVCPVIFNKTNGVKEIYQHYKNNFNDIENALGLLKYNGTGYLKFSGTPLGNLYVQLCYDVFQTSRSGNFSNIDILLVPSFNSSTTFTEALNAKAQEYKLVATYANVINNIDNIKSSFFVPEGQGQRANQSGVKPLHRSQWESKPERKGDIFQFLPSGNTYVKVDEHGFKFNIRNLEVDILELDRRRYPRT
ncbi:MAG: hypothetical protein ACUZ77_00635 [Candidatus Brocadiales bacterium]